MTTKNIKMKNIKAKNIKVKKKILLFCLVLFFPLFFLLGHGAGANESSSSKCTLQIEISEAIGPATLDLLQRGLEKAQTNSCSSLLVLLNTPGGSLQSTRLIVEEIINSPIPVLCLIHPSGGHAGSAGAIILQACHVSAAMEATNIGAATPIASTGKEIPEDLRKKLVNDTRSWLEGITKLRKRSKKFGQDIILEAKAVSAKEALSLGAIDYVAKRKTDFLEFAKGRKTRIGDREGVTIEVGMVIIWKADLRHRLVSFFTDPQTAYMMFMGSLALLYYEITHPGLLVPGVIGAAGLILSLISLHKLDVTWGGMFLLLLGVALMIAEAFVAGFGVLGIGGVACFVIGSFILFDPARTGVELPVALITSTSIGLSTIMLLIAYMAFNTRKVQKRGSFDDMIGLVGKVVAIDPQDARKGQAEVAGETWHFYCRQQVSKGNRLKVIGYKGLTINVEIEKED